ncbi:unnamed protein product [Blepharisma stoltei]|uniref:C2 NT-type domain-containing protein n=1 Tax=Blepharisma stoltei TaxID=1481888 RepID=A0AAU9K1K2_9CILI|nr:unnamed protein product [Blepharisma stoltei]
MKFLERLGAKPEFFMLELIIQKVYIGLQDHSELVIVIKRNSGERDNTPRVDWDPSKQEGLFDQMFHFKVTMYKKKDQYLPKWIYFNLMMIKDQKIIKNGKARLDISVILNSDFQLESYEIELKKCSDKNACLIIDASMRSWSEEDEGKSSSTLAREYDEAKMKKLRENLIYSYYQESKKSVDEELSSESNESNKLPSYNRRGTAMESVEEEPESENNKIHPITIDTVPPLQAPKPESNETSMDFDILVKEYGKPIDSYFSSELTRIKKEVTPSFDFTGQMDCVPIYDTSEDDLQHSKGSSKDKNKYLDRRAENYSVFHI